MILLDTNIVSETFRPRPDPAVSAWFDLQKIRDLYICTPVLAELLFGAERLDPGRAKDHLARAIDGARLLFRGRVLPVDEATAVCYAGIAAKRERAGRKMEQMDALIVAIALVHGATLATRNTKDFRDIGVDLIDPFSASKT